MLFESLTICVLGDELLKRIVSGITLFLLLLSMATLTFQPVRSDPTIWIVDDDGPADFNTIRDAVDAASSGDTIFVKNGTYYESVFMDKSLTLIGEDKYATIIDGGHEQSVISLVSPNITISGFTLKNGMDGIGVWSQGDNVSENIVTQTRHGIALHFAGETIIKCNILTQNSYGIVLDRASGSILRNNIITNNSYNLDIFGVELSDYIHDIDSSNTVNGKPVYYLINKHNLVIEMSNYPNAGYLAIVNSSNVNVRNLNLTDNGQGILSAFSINSTITNVTVSNCACGIHLVGTSGNFVVNSTIMNNEYGIMDQAGGNIIQYNNMTDNLNAIKLHYSSNSLVTENTIEGNYKGIVVGDGRNNIITHNLITNNSQGIGLVEAYNNAITANTITNNDYALAFALSNEGNIITHNNFINNTQNVDSNYGTSHLLCTWDSGYPTGGNYWSNYNGTDLYSGPFQNEPGPDGIGDSPYTIDENNTDNYPFTEPYIPHIITGDINQDGKIDMRDISLAAIAFGSYPGHPRWNPAADINIDNKVDMRDIGTVARHFGETYP
jgi:parallel beta-helix repeat protein